MSNKYLLKIAEILPTSGMVLTNDGNIQKFQDDLEIARKRKVLEGGVLGTSLGLAGIGVGALGASRMKDPTVLKKAISVGLGGASGAGLGFSLGSSRGQQLESRAKVGLDNARLVPRIYATVGKQP